MTSSQNDAPTSDAETAWREAEARLIRVLEEPHSDDDWDWKDRLRAVIAEADRRFREAHPRTGGAPRSRCTY